MDRRWLAGVLLAAAALLGSTVGSNVEFGDGAEALAGVRDLGIVHAPGYFLFTLLARLFATALPIGDLSVRVALFSTVCSVATVGFVFGCSRRLGASRPGAAIGSLALAVSTTFWFDAGYAKAYALTSLLIASTFWCLLSWKAGASRRMLGLAAALVGLSLGASWQSMAVAVPAFAVLLWSQDRRLSPRDLVVVVVAGIGAAAAIATSVLIRASMHPTVSWGNASNLKRLTDLLLMRDFVNLSGAGAGGSASVTSGSAVAALGPRVLRLPAFFLADSGVVILALFVVGIVVAAGRRRPARFWVLMTMVVLNFVAVSLVIAPGMKIRGYKLNREALLRFGGYHLAAGIATACFVALAATWLLERAAVWMAGPVSGRDRQRRRARQDVPVAGWLVVVGLLVVVGPGLLNRADASHRQPAFARSYAQNVLSSLPRHAVLVSLVAERSFPIEYEQVVHHTRTDVQVVQIEALTASWYRDELTKTFGLDLSGPGGPNAVALRLVDGLRGHRDVYYDYAAATALARRRPELGFRKVGLVAEALPDGVGQTYDGAKADRLFAHFRLGGIYDDPARLRWPNDSMLAVYAVVHYDRAVAAATRGSLATARAELRKALRVDPGNADATKALATLNAQR